MPEFMPSHNRRPAILTCVGLVLAAGALSVAVCHGQKPSLTPELSPESPSDPADAPKKARKLRSVRADVRRNVQGVSGDDDDDSLPSVSIDPDVFADRMWDLSEVSQCVRAPGDVMVTYPDPYEMLAVSLRYDGQPRVPVSVIRIQGGIRLKVGRMILFYELPTDGSQEEVEGILTRLCRDVQMMVHRTDWAKIVLCQGPDDKACDDYVGELQGKGSYGLRPVQMIDDLLDSLTDEDFFDEIDRYKSTAFGVKPKFSRGLGHFSVMIEHAVIDGKSILVYSVTSTSVGDFEFATPEEVVEFIDRHIDRP